MYRVDEKSVPLRYIQRNTAYQRMSADPQVNPLPNAARQTRSPDLTAPASTASHKAIGMEAAVVLP